MFSKCLKLKQRFNALSIFVDRVNFTHVEILGKKHKNIDDLLSYLNIHKMNIRNNLEVVKSKIYKLTDINKKMQFRKSLELYRIINQDLLCLEKSRQITVSSIANTDEFYNELSDILIGLCDGENELEKFYKEFLYKNEYKNEEYANLIKNIEQICKELLEIRTNVNYEEFIKKSLQCANFLSNLYDMIDETYSAAVVYKYLYSLYQSIDDLNLDKEINNQAELKSIRTIKINGKQALEKLQQAINTFDARNINKHMLVASNNIQGALRHINLFKKSHKLLKTQFDKLRAMISQIHGISAELSKDISAIQDNFKDKNIDLFNEINVITGLTKKITRQIDEAFNETYVANLTHTEYITMHEQLITTLVDWKEKMKKALATIETKISDFIAINDGYARAKIITIYLKKSKTSVNSSNHAVLNNFDVIIKTIDKNLNNLSQDFDKHYKQAQSELENINADLNAFINKVYVDQHLLIYARNLTRYAEQFRHYEQAQETFAAVDDFNGAHHYRDTINSLLNFLPRVTKQKRSAHNE